MLVNKGTRHLTHNIAPLPSLPYKTRKNAKHSASPFNIYSRRRLKGSTSKEVATDDVGVVEVYREYAGGDRVLPS